MDTKEDSDIFSYLSLSETKYYGPRHTGLSWGANFMFQQFLCTNRWATRKRLACGLRHHAHLPHLGASAVRVTHRHKQALILLDGSHAAQEGNHHDDGTHNDKHIAQRERGGYGRVLQTCCGSGGRSQGPKCSSHRTEKKNHITFWNARWFLNISSYPLLDIRIIFPHWP